tara:strand:- start:39 stop:284 length:246 start_codon:yes stop_codon:yes gene_type:complete
MSTKYMTIESEIGPLSIKIEYDLDSGQRGNYYTEHIPPSVEITHVELDGDLSIDEDIQRELEEEILDDELTYDPEDYKEKE